MTRDEISVMGLLLFGAVLRLFGVVETSYTKYGFYSTANELEISVMGLLLFGAVLRLFGVVETSYMEYGFYSTAYEL